MLLLWTKFKNLFKRKVVILSLVYDKRDGLNMNGGMNLEDLYYMKDLEQEDVVNMYKLGEILRELINEHATEDESENDA
jgi:hypothetical protein